MAHKRKSGTCRCTCVLSGVRQKDRGRNAHCETRDENIGVVYVTLKEAANLYRRSGINPPPELADEEQIRKHKYGARYKVLDGIRFDSTLEAEAYRILMLWEKAGKINRVIRQPVYTLQEGFRDESGKWHRAVRYIADFFYTERDNEAEDGAPPKRYVTVDVKGFRTPAFRIKEKIFRAKYPDQILEVWDRAKVKELARL